jgi:hypothetical protein
MDGIEYRADHGRDPDVTYIQLQSGLSIQANIYPLESTTRGDAVCHDGVVRRSIWMAEKARE